MRNGMARVIVIENGEIIGTLERVDMQNYLRVRSILKI